MAGPFVSTKPPIFQTLEPFNTDIHLSLVQYKAFAPLVLPEPFLSSLQ